MTSDGGPPAIYLASKRGDAAEVATLLNDDPKAHALKSDGRTALAAAAAGGHVDVAEALLTAGAEDVCDRGWTAACHAAFYGQTEVLKLLSEKLGVRAVAAPPSVNMTPLLLSCLKGHVACAKLILEMEPTALAARDANGRSALMLASHSGSGELIEYLVVKHGARLEDTSSDGRTALHWAVTAHRPSSVSTLAQLGANPEACTNADPNAAIVPGKDRSRGETVLELARSFSGRDPTMKFVVKYLEKYLEHRAQHGTSDPMPSMDSMPHIVHAEAFVSEEADKAAKAAVEPAADLKSATACDDSDIFGSSDVPSGASVIEEIGNDEGDDIHKDAAQSELELARRESHGDLDALD